MNEYLKKFENDIKNVDEYIILKEKYIKFIDENINELNVDDVEKLYIIVEKKILYLLHIFKNDENYDDVIVDILFDNIIN